VSRHGSAFFTTQRQQHRHNLLATEGRKGSQHSHPFPCTDLSDLLHGKEGVDGSSPSEGSAKAPQTGAFDLSYRCTSSSVPTYGTGFGTTRRKRPRFCCLDRHQGWGRSAKKHRVRRARSRRISAENASGKPRPWTSLSEQRRLARRGSPGSARGWRRIFAASFPQRGGEWQGVEPFAMLDEQLGEAKNLFK